VVKDEKEVTPQRSTDVPWDEVEVWLTIAQDELRSQADVDDRLRASFGFGWATAERFGLGYYKGQPDQVFRDERLYIPARGTDGSLLAVRCYRRESDRKMLPLYRGMKTCLFALDQIPTGTKTLVLCEGERDCMVLYEHGFVAITGTGGAGTWKREWSQQIAELGVESVIILYDHDDPGREGAQAAAYSLALAGVQVSIASWPEGCPSGFDVADWFATGKTGEQLQSEVLDKAVPCQPSAAHDDEEEIIDLGRLQVLQLRKRMLLTVRTRLLADVLAATGRFFRRGRGIWFADLDDAFLIEDADQLGGALDGFVEFAQRVKVDKASDETELQFQTPPYPLFRRLLHAPKQRSRLPMLDHYSRIPIFDKDFQLIPPGYHEPTRSFYAGPAIQPASGTPYLDVLCEDFAWRDQEADLANFLGILLTAVLIQQFIGKHPAVVINGNQCGLGKTLLANLIALLVDGRPADPITYTSDGAEFEKQLATRVKLGDNVILIDNVDTTVIRSSALDRSVTSPKLNFRLLGANASINMPNSVLFAMTVNEGMLSRDLVDRCLPIQLYWEGPAKQRVYKQSNLQGFVLENRWAILEELVGMVTPWAEAGRPMVETRPTRFGDWSSIIGSILAFNGVDGFLANWDEAEVMMADDTVEMVNLVLAACKMSRHNQWLEAREVVDIASAHGLFSSIVSRGPKGASVAMSRHLGAFKDRPLPIDENVTAVLRIEKDDYTNKKRYRFELDGELPQNVLVPKWSPKEPTPKMENGVSVMKLPEEVVETKVTCLDDYRIAL
jgi:hypothetical protein